MIDFGLMAVPEMRYSWDFYDFVWYFWNGKTEDGKWGKNVAEDNKAAETLSPSILIRSSRFTNTGLFNALNDIWN